MKRGKNSGEIIVFDDRCALIYTPDERGVIFIARVIPLDEQILYECIGSYTKGVKQYPYYILAKNKKEAKIRYGRIFGYFPSSVREIPPGEEADAILTDTNRMPL